LEHAAAAENTAQLCRNDARIFAMRFSVHQKFPWAFALQSLRMSGIPVSPTQVCFFANLFAPVEQ
jgi:hypothetical protein